MPSPLFNRFTVIPAIDLKGGKVVRLLRGAMEQATIYGDDPAMVARQFESEGADLSHIVDLDGAIAGVPRNLDSVHAIRAAVRCRLDVSGGLRSMDAVRQIIDAGTDIVSIGSAAMLKPQLLAGACAAFPGRVFGSIDARDGYLAIKGWVETSQLTVADAITRFRAAGVAAITLTDISRDGTQTGVDPHAYVAAAARAGLPVIASGGVATIDDLRQLAEHFASGVVGAITGRAIYERRFSLAEAIAAVR